MNALTPTKIASWPEHIKAANLHKIMGVLTAQAAEIEHLREALTAIQHHEQGYAPELRAIARAALEARE